MTELHPAVCTCRDCRSRRLIREDAVTADRYAADELEDFGYLLKEKPAAQGGYWPHAAGVVSARSGPTSRSKS
jgi:hypothetical protein